jgi:peptide chain release factor subunit 1
VFFCGNVSQKDGELDLKLWEIVPPDPLKVRIYRCDQKFVLDPLKEMVREKEVYGLITVDKSEAAVGFLRGSHISVYKHLESLVPPRTKAGGQSAQRFERVREGLLLSFLKEVAEVAASAFRNEKDLKGIIVGGPGPIKERFVNEILPQDLKDKVIAIKDTSYSGTEALEEVVERAEEELKDARVSKEKNALKKFFLNLARDTGLAVYGLKETLNALELGAMELLIVSEEAPYVVYKLRCESCGKESVEIVKHGENVERTCKTCNATLFIDELPLADYLEEKAKEFGTEVIVVSSSTQEGAQFLSLGGVGGILRCKLE